MPALDVSAVRTPAAAVAPTVVNVNVHLTNSGVIASQREAENFLAAALDRLRLQGRLPMGAAA
jgi:hypothetical protein